MARKIVKIRTQVWLKWSVHNAYGTGYDAQSADAKTSPEYDAESRNDAEDDEEYGKHGLLTVFQRT